MGVYTGLDPQAALNKWYQLRQTPPDQLGSLSPEERAEATSPGGMVTLANENPAAWKLRAQGTVPTANANGKGQTRNVFNEMTGQMDAQKVKTVWDHPETWIQLGAGAGLGGVVAAPFIAGAMGGGAGAGAGGGLTSTALTNAAVQGGLGAVQGGMQGGLKGAVTGGLTSFGTGLIPGVGPANTLGGFAKNAALQAGEGAVKGAIGGGGVSGALKGAAGGAVNAVPLGNMGLNPVLSGAVKGAAQGGITGGVKGAALGGVGGATSAGLNQAIHAGTAPIMNATSNPVASTALNTGTNLATKIGTGLAVGGAAAALNKAGGGSTPTGMTPPYFPPGTSLPSSTSAPGGSPSSDTFGGPNSTFKAPGTSAPSSSPGGSTMADDTSSPGFWQQYGPAITQVGGGVAGALVAKNAQKNAMVRSPEEAAALTGAQGAAGGAGNAASSLMTQSRPWIANAGNYYQTLLNGNRAAMANATAAPRAQLQEAYRGAQSQLGASGIRGAARDVVSGNLQRQGAGQIAGLTTGVQPAAAQALGNLGTETSRTAVPLYNTAGTVYSQLLNQGLLNRKNAQEEGSSTGKAIGKIVSDLGTIPWGKTTKKPGTTTGGTPGDTPISPGQTGGYYPQPPPPPPDYSDQYYGQPATPPISYDPTWDNY